MALNLGKNYFLLKIGVGKNCSFLGSIYIQSYFTFSLQRSVDLDKLQAPPGHVVTGVKFRNLGGHLNLELRVRYVHFQKKCCSTWKLIPSDNDCKILSFCRECQAVCTVSIKPNDIFASFEWLKL